MGLRIKVSGAVHGLKTLSPKDPKGLDPLKESAGRLSSYGRWPPSPGPGSSGALGPGLWGLGFVFLGFGFLGF